MSVARLIWWRDTRAMLTTTAGYGTLAGFLALAGWSFADLLRRNEGGFISAQATWATAVAPWLPVLAALATMRVFAEERQTGTLETLLTAPVSARDVVAGKFGAALTLALAGVVLAAAPVGILARLAPRTAGTFSVAGMAVAMAALGVQAAAWTAIGTLASLLARQQAAAGMLTVLLIGAPYALYAGLMAWLPRARLSLWRWPPLEHAADAASGLLALGPPVLYLSVAACALFVCVRVIEARDVQTR